MPKLITKSELTNYEQWQLMTYGNILEETFTGDADDEREAEMHWREMMHALTHEYPQP